MAKLEKRVTVALATTQADNAKHQNAIDQLARDNQKLMQELALESKQDSMVNRNSATAEIKRLQDQGDTYTRKIELERRRIAELEKQIELVRTKISSQRRRMGGVNVSKQNNQVLSKQIRVMENRLEKSIVRYNEILGKNKLLKDKIDDLRKERQIFDGIYKKLEKEMQNEKKEMARLVEECNCAYVERDEAKQEIVKLKQQADEEQQDFQREWKRLGELIERDKKARDGSHSQDSDISKVGELSAEEETALKHKIVKSNWNIGKEKIQIQLSHEKAHNYEEMFAKIQEETGVTDIDELVQRFVEAEEKNFKLFTQVNDMNREIELLEQQVVSVDGEISKYRGQGVKSENQRKRILYELEQRLDQTNNKADLYEQKQINAQKILQQLKLGIQTMFDKLGGAMDDEAIQDMLGDEGVTEANVMQYLGIIEQRANEILQAFAVTKGESLEALQAVLSSGDAQAKGKGPDSSIYSIAQSDQAGTQALSPKSPKGLQFPDINEIEKNETINNETFEDISERPLTMQELQNNMIKQMQEVQRSKSPSEGDVPEQ